MDKRLLLVVLCLQVFLLITSFTSTDAATLSRDYYHRPPSGQMGRWRSRVKNPLSRCNWKPRGRAVAGYSDPRQTEEGSGAIHFGYTY